MENPTFGQQYELTQGRAIRTYRALSRSSRPGIVRIVQQWKSCKWAHPLVYTCQLATMRVHTVYRVVRSGARLSALRSS